MKKRYPFTKRKAKSTKDGYGNRHKYFCNGCGRKVADEDYGNSTGQRYSAIYTDEMLREHLKRCSKARRILAHC